MHFKFVSIEEANPVHRWQILPGATIGADGWLSGQAECVDCHETIDYHSAPGYKKEPLGPSGNRGPDDSGIGSVIETESSTESAAPVNSPAAAERQRHKPGSGRLT